MTPASQIRGELLAKIKTLNETIWERRLTEPSVHQWLTQFQGTPGIATAEQEQLQALYMLSRFVYFGSREIREMLRTVYRDLYRRPILQGLRRGITTSSDLSVLERLFQEQLSRTRFIGVGNPSESGTHLLYYFRQENTLPKTLFRNPYEVFNRTSKPGCLTPLHRLSLAVQLREPEVTRYVFLDDFCGSGQQASTYLSDLVQELKAANKNLIVEYYLLVATSEGLDVLRKALPGITVQCVLELDESFKSFSDESRFFAPCPSLVQKHLAETVFMFHGKRLVPSAPMGYGNCQLMIGFSYNTPDNTLPVFWFDENPLQWSPIFRRYNKNYGGSF